MKLETERLYMKILTQDESEAYYLLSQNHGFRQFQISDYRKSSIEDANIWISKIEKYQQRNGFGIVGIFEKESLTLIGLGALKHLENEGKSPVELMYRISDQFWGKGYGLEVASALVNHAFYTLNMDHLVATVDPQNYPSKQILTKLGFKFEKKVKIESYEEELHKLFR